MKQFPPRSFHVRGCPFTPCSLAALGGLLVVLPGAAQVAEIPEETGSIWFIRGGPRVVFNIKGSVEREVRPLPAGRYKDGYVLPDAGGSIGGTTWNWGYENAAQISGDQLALQRLDGLPDVHSFNDMTDNPSVGGEILFGSEIAFFEMLGKEARVGFELGYAYTDFSVKNSSSRTGMATQATDTYSLGGITPPQAPYNGTAAGPGPLINLNPAATAPITSPVEASTRGELQADLHVLKFGFWLEYPFTEKLQGSGSFGFASIYTDALYSYTETYQFTDPGIADIGPKDGGAGGREWKPGAYLQGRLQYTFSERWQAYVGGEFHYSEDMHYSENGFHINMDYGAMFGLTGGLNFNF